MEVRIVIEAMAESEDAIRLPSATALRSAGSRRLSWVAVTHKILKQSEMDHGGRAIATAPFVKERQKLLRARRFVGVREDIGTNQSSPDVHPDDWKWSAIWRAVAGGLDG